MEKHLTLVASFHIAVGILGIILSAVIWVVLVGWGIITGDDSLMAAASLIASIISAILLFVSILGIIGAVGLLKRRSWARILILVVSALYLIKVPYGTALGVYSIWALLNEETKQLLASGRSS
jgi:hypothetical protein